MKINSVYTLQCGIFLVALIVKGLKIIIEIFGGNAKEETE